MGKRPRSRPRAQGKRGAATLEYAIVLPVLLLFLLGIMDMGRLMWIYAGLNRGVEAASRCAAVDANACGTTAQIQNVAAGEVWGASVSSSVFSVSTATCGIQVSASYTFTFFTPGISSITLAPSACFTKMQ
jgi:Flp pilus assembly protein TadG